MLFMNSAYAQSQVEWKTELSKAPSIAKLIKPNTVVNVVSPESKTMDIVLPASEDPQVILLPSNPGAGRYWALGSQAIDNPGEVKLATELIATQSSKKPGGAPAYNAIVVTKPSKATKMAVVYMEPGGSGSQLSKINVTFKAVK